MSEAHQANSRGAVTRQHFVCRTAEPVAASWVCGADEGSHHIFHRDGIDEMINLQKDGGQAKPYQIKQVRELILRHNLGELDDA